MLTLDEFMIEYNTDQTKEYAKYLLAQYKNNPYFMNQIIYKRI